MEIKQNPIIIKNKNFKSVLIKVVFPFETILEEIPIAELLPKIIGWTNKKYPKEGDFKIAKIKRSIASLGTLHRRYGKTSFIEFNLLLPDPKIIKEDIMPNTIKFLMETIYHPNVVNNEFANDIYQQEMRILKQGGIKARKDIYSLASINVLKEIDNLGYITNNAIDKPELIKKITNKKLYQFYEKVILNNSPQFFIMGDVSEEQIQSLFQPYIKKIVSFNTDYNLYLTKVKTKEIDEEGDFNQSLLSVVYNIKDIKEEDHSKIYMIGNLLASRTSAILQENLRDKNGLTYAARVKPRARSATFIITALTDKDSKEKVLKQIDKSLEDLKDEKRVQPLLTRIIEMQEKDMLRNRDKKYIIFDNEIDKILQIAPTEEESFQESQKITSKDIKKMTEQFDLQLIYFLKGVKNEK